MVKEVGNTDQRQPRYMKDQARKNHGKAREWEIQTDSSQGLNGSRFRNM